MQTGLFSNRILLIFALLIAALSTLVAALIIQKQRSQKVLGDTSLTNPLSLNNIFATDHPSLEYLQPSHIRTIVTTGDVMLGRYINLQTTKTGRFTFPLEQTAEVLKRTDIAFINLEGPLVENCPLTNKGMVFCGDIRHSQGLRFAGIDVANLANNHAADYGQRGITEAVNALQRVGIQAAGLGEAEVMDVRGIRFAFLGYNDIGKEVGIAPADQARISANAQKAKQQADIVVAAFHWGQEYTHVPVARQKYLAHLAIDAGADLVVGNHPHWVQPIEIYRDKVIVYSQGNFVFDQFWSDKTQEGMAGKFTFYDKRLVDVEFLPIRISKQGQPFFLNGIQKVRALNELKTISVHWLAQQR